ncbi:MAG: S41 family peptidase [Gemmatimonadales bacterium]
MRSVTVLGLGLVAPLMPLAGQQLSATERAAAVATIWAEARYNFAYWDHVQADWDSALAATLKLATEPQSDIRFYRRLRRFLALLGDGQAAVIPPANLRSRIARPPLLLESIERRPYILDYAENDEMRIARPERLAEIVAVQGLPAESWIRDSVLPEIAAATPADRWQRAVAWMLQGEKGTLLQLSLRLAGGGQRGISVTRSVSLNDRWPLEPPELQIDSLPDGVVVVRIAALADEDVVRQFDRAFPDFIGVNGLVLDLRRAGGRTGENGYQLLARLTNTPFPAVRWRTPAYRAVFRARRLPDSAMYWYGPPPAIVAPRVDRPPYDGPVAVLASSATTGAAEDLLVAFRNTGRGVIIGEPSGGSPGEPLEIQLPKNWTVTFSVTRHAFSNGEEFAGTGIRPEIPVSRTAADVLAGRDAVLERAREYLGGKRR